MSYQCSDFDEESTEAGWIQWFCSLQGHDFYVEVDEDYIRDNFNLYGLRPVINNYDRALNTILGREPCDEDMCNREFVEHYREVTNLYGLIHARYILSPRGLAQMKDKLVCGTFGKCPRVLCHDQYTLPVGLSDEIRTHRVRVYCPCCQEVYDPHDARQDRDPSSGGVPTSARNGLPSSNAAAANTAGYAEIDGAFFGPSFPHIFLQTYPVMVPLTTPNCYQPRVFGFRVHNRKSVVQWKLEQGEYGESLIPDKLKPRRGLSSSSAARSRPSDNGCDGGDEATADDAINRNGGRGGNSAGGANAQRSEVVEASKSRGDGGDGDFPKRSDKTVYPNVRSEYG